MRYILRNAHASLKAAPHPMLRKGASKFQTTVDVKPGHVATKSNNWPMPSVKDKMSHFQNANTLCH